MNYLSFKKRSDSNHAEVFIYSPPLCSTIYAVKIIPSIDFLETYIKKEIEISNYLSKSNPNFYPIVYQTGYCELKESSQSKIFYNTSHVYYIVYELLEIDLEVYFIKELNQNNVKNIYQDLKFILETIIIIIYDLNINQGYHHGDLHIRNVMFKNQNSSEKQIKIIDFGTTIVYKHDVHFLSDWLLFLLSCKDYFIKKDIDIIVSKLNKLEKRTIQLESVDIEKIQNDIHLLFDI